MSRRASEASNLSAGVGRVLRSLAATRARETERKGWETRLEVVSIAEAVR